MKRPPRRAIAIAALSLPALSCASGSGPDGSPSPTASSAVPVPQVSLTMVPSVGEHTFEWGPAVDPLVLRPAISWNVDFTAPEDLNELWIRVRLLREDGTACLIGAERVGSVTRGERYVAFGDRFAMPEVGPMWTSLCSDRFATDTVDVNLVDGPLASPADEPRVRQGFSFTHFYFFQRVGFTPEGDSPG